MESMDVRTGQGNDYPELGKCWTRIGGHEYRLHGMASELGNCVTCGMHLIDIASPDVILEVGREIWEMGLDRE